MLFFQIKCAIELFSEKSYELTEINVGASQGSFSIFACSNQIIRFLI